MPRPDSTVPLAGSPDDLAWLGALIDRSPLLPAAELRAAWRTVLPWLPPEARFELAAALLSVERAVAEA